MLQQVIEAAEAKIANTCGPLEPTTVTVRITPVGGRLRLPKAPAISLTTVTVSDSGGTLDLDDLYLDLEDGVVSRNDGGVFHARYYDVAYQAGRATLPADLREAVVLLVKYMWEPMRGSGQRPGPRNSETAAETLPGAEFTLPFRVQQLLADHEQAGFA